MPRLMPSATGAVVGAGAAWFRKNDIDKGRTQLSKQWGTYAELGAAAFGIVSDLLRLPIPVPVSDAISISGFALVGERLTRSALSGSFGTGSPQMIRGSSYAGAPFNMNVGTPTRYPIAPGAAAFSTKERSATAF